MELQQRTKDYILSIDKPGTILMVTDAGPCTLDGIDEYYGELIDFLLTQTKHMVVRVGGFSHRLAWRLYGHGQYLLNEITNPQRFELYFYDHDYTDPWCTVYEVSNDAEKVQALGDETLHILPATNIIYQMYIPHCNVLSIIKEHNIDSFCCVSGPRGMTILALRAYPFLWDQLDSVQYGLETIHRRIKRILEKKD